jgi:glycosyltransferase involved in cell wall biosynthesis
MTTKQDASPRRHCMIVHAYYPLGETRVQREAEALLKHNYQVDVICLRSANEPAVDEFKGVRIYRLPVRRHAGGKLAQLIEYLDFFLRAMFKVARLHRQKRYSTIQAHNLPDFLIFAAWLPKLWGAGLILDLHDLMPEFYMGRFHQDAKSLSVRLVRLQERLSCSFADRVITVSHHWRQALAERGVPAEKISVVMNVADDAIFRLPDAPARAQSTGLRLIYHGSVTQRYGLDLVLQAMARLRQQAPDLHLTILGRGDHMPTLIQMAGELELGDQVTFHRGLVPAEELPEIILNHDAGVVPYRNDPFTDGLVPTKLMEYAALGLPSIAARTTAIASYFQDTMVELFTPGDVDDLARCIMRLYTDRVWRAQLAQQADQFNQRYNWTKVGGEYVALVERLGQRKSE